MKIKKGLMFLKMVGFILVVFVIAVVTVASYDLFVTSSLGISGKSMEPNIHEKTDTVMFWENFYKLDRGDVIVFYKSENKAEFPDSENPAKVTVTDFFMKCGDVVSDLINVGIKVFSKDESKLLAHNFKRNVDGYKIVIKRVIGVSGDVVKIENANLYIQYGGEGDFVLQEEDYIYEKMSEKAGGSGVNDGEWTVGEHEYFVLGDNRNVSVDSEDYGPIGDYQIIGKVFVVRRNGETIKVEDLI